MSKAMIYNNRPTQWDAKLFLIAGVFMLVNTACLWIRAYSDYQLSILWAAVPAITALSASIFALLKLYKRVAPQAPKLALSGAGFALIAGAALVLAAVWIFITSVFGSGISDSPQLGLSLLTGVFMVAMVIAFLCYGIACLLVKNMSRLGYLLFAPVASWTVMLLVGLLKGFEVGLSLDFYTNAIIGIAFLAIGILLKAPLRSRI
ncbi:hypothetical protein PSECIP111854_00494 [Pseudoalteromonas sp. CIP111854]|uniref:Uncharacterized protein n=1 Tax=Pseudoalteromonas holothuriae TaxID=2963714 RepID=A0A9W4QRS5_9GAMM|nr:hypothetical protein [Pseudoalteromonas sp. CIP111854]CAH9050264.1 hypothetical protein PSECIP111854_00494 [Pseudoalteromonas sp. CIP111854]